MRKPLIAGILASIVGLVGISGSAYADSIGRYECNIIGAIGLEPIGDHDGHLLRSFDYFCAGVDGIFKGALLSAVSVSEVDGSRVTFHLVGGVHRIAGGLAVGETLEGTGSSVMQEGGRARTASAGTMIFKFASGKLAPLSGKTFKWAAKPIGYNRFDLEYED
jgi:hypothetical protein